LKVQIKLLFFLVLISVLVPFTNAVTLTPYPDNDIRFTAYGTYLMWTQNLSFDSLTVNESCASFTNVQLGSGNVLPNLIVSVPIGNATFTQFLENNFTYITLSGLNINATTQLTYPIEPSHVYQNGSEVSVGTDWAWNNANSTLTVWANLSGATTGSQIGLDTGATNPPLTITIAGNVGGSTIPPSGTYSNWTFGSIVTICETSNSGYGFAYWLANGTNIGASNPLIFVITGNTTIQPAFYLIRGSTWIPPNQNTTQTQNATICTVTFYVFNQTSPLPNALIIVSNITNYTGQIIQGQSNQTDQYGNATFALSYGTYAYQVFIQGSKINEGVLSANQTSQYVPIYYEQNIPLPEQAKNVITNNQGIIIICGLGVASILLAFMFIPKKNARRRK